MAKFQKGTPRPEGAGRKKGIPNKITKEARDVIQEIIEGKSDKLDNWLDAVASDNPAKAIELYLKMAEFVMPKLSRTENIGSPFSLTISNILAEIDGKTTGLPRLSDIEEFEEFEMTLGRGEK